MGLAEEHPSVRTVGRLAVGRPGCCYSRPIVSGLLLFLTALHSVAEPLTSALARTYQQNPSIQAALAGVKATAELLPQARAGYLPNLSLQGVGTQTTTRQTTRTHVGTETANGRTDYTLTSPSLELILTLNVYNGGATSASLAAAEASVAAALARLDGTVDQVLLSVTTSYADVLRLNALIQLNDDVAQQLRQLEQESRSLFAKRLGTLTDVAQATASVANIGAQRTSLEASLAAARGNYTALSGQAPDSATDWPSLPPLPGTLEEIKAIAEAGNPALRAARFSADSARAGIAVAKGALRPTVDLYATYLRTWDSYRYTSPSTADLFQPEEDIAIGVQLNVPIFSGGKHHSQVRQAHATFNQSQSLMTDTYRQLMSTVEADWAAFEMARARTELVAQEVEAMQQTLDGFYRQFQSGLSTMKDVLDARQNLDSALEQQLQARYDLFMGQVNLLQVMGRYDPRGLGLAVEPLGAESYVEAVRHRLFGTDID